MASTISFIINQPDPRKTPNATELGPKTYSEVPD